MNIFAKEVAFFELCDKVCDFACGYKAKAFSDDKDPDYALARLEEDRCNKCPMWAVKEKYEDLLDECEEVPPAD